MNPIRKVAVIVGSLRKESINRKLALAIARLAPAGWQFDSLAIDELPLYNQDHDAAMPAQAAQFKQRVEAADALLFATPEYNRSIPGVLKNALDVGSRPYGKNSFANKPAGVVGASVGAVGTAAAQQHLRNILAYLDVPTLGQPEVFIHFTEGLIGDHGEISRPETEAFLQAWVGRYVAWVDRHAATSRSAP